MFPILRSIQKAFRTGRQTTRPRVKLAIEQLDDRIVPSTIPNLANAHFNLALGGHTGQLYVALENTSTGNFIGSFKDPTTKMSTAVSGTVGAEPAGSATASLTFDCEIYSQGSSPDSFGQTFGVSFTGQLNGFGTSGRYYSSDQLTGSITEFLANDSTVVYTVTGNDYAPPTTLQTPTYIGSGVLSASVAFDTAGQEWQAVVFSGSNQLWIYGPSGAQEIGNGGVSSASIAFTPSGQLIDYVVFTSTQLWSYDAAGSHFIGSGVQSASVTFDPTGGAQVTAIVYAGGAEYLQLGAGTNLLPVASNVQSVSLAFTSGNSLESARVDPDGTAAVYTDSGTQSIGSGIQSVGIGFNDLAQNDTNQRVLDVVFASGDLWQY